ncbi:MAG TPA: DUF2399 domain-containing protein [Bacillales bacterium]|nr:DUF2399 domain-containing protein [Bacillales bacterium]
MLEKDELDYIATFMLKTGERLVLEAANDDHATIVDVKIIKQTERTYRVAGIINVATGFVDDIPETIDQELMKLKLTPKKKVIMDDHHPNTIKWFDSGWMMKEIRFKKDGKTPDSIHYRMGYRLYNYLNEQSRQKEEELEQEFTRWKAEVNMVKEPKTIDFSPQRKRGFSNCQNNLYELCLLELSELKTMPYIPNTWSMNKIFKYLDFLLAFLQIGLEKKEFDWKEIGASYYKEIGGSKEFDPYKDEFIEQLETIAQCPAAILGMTSLGKITPVYFSGPLSGQFSTFQYGPVHALTDLAISEEKYKTSAAVFWLVENRAILTRIAAETNFLKETNSLILCVDGHLRSAHKQFIGQVLANSSIEQVIIWSDYDSAGLQIAREIYETVSEHYESTIKWINHDQTVITNWTEYQKDLDHFLKNNRMEQEQVLGGAVDWKRWIQ